MELFRVLGQKLAGLEDNSDEAPQASVKEQQIEVLIPVARRNPKLSAHEAEFASDLQHELLQAIQERLVEITFRHNLTRGSIRNLRPLTTCPRKSRGVFVASGDGSA
jgi:hypothetical protein